MLINRQSVDDYLSRELNSYVWMKSLKREQIERELSYLKVRPLFKTRPWLHQLVCFYIGLYEPEFLYLLDMGLGKSKILSDLITHKIREKKIARALVGVPRVINMSSWRDALLEHSDLEPWLCNTESIEEKWERLADPSGQVTVVDYQGLCLAVSKKERGKKKANKLVPDERKIAMLQKLYPFIGIDESHKLKRSTSLWFSVVNHLTATANYVYAMTGTVFDRNPEEAWAQFQMVDNGKTFGTLGMFRAAFYSATPDPFAGTAYTYIRRRSKYYHSFLQNKSIRYDSPEVAEIDVPMKVNIKVEVDFSEEQRQHYRRVLQDAINAKNGGERTITAPWLRMRQIVAGFFAWEDATGKHLIKFKENPKLDALEELLDGMGDSKVVICHYLIETGQLISDRLRELHIQHVWLYGGTKDHDSVRSTFMQDPDCRVFLMNTAAGGVGNDGLQKVARYMVFFETPTPPSDRKQTEMRIHRPGQLERVYIYDLVMRRSVDSKILASIEEGLDFYQQLVSGGHRFQDDLSVLGR
jgi:hypothetical protein